MGLVLISCQLVLLHAVKKMNNELSTAFSLCRPATYLVTCPQTSSSFFNWYVARIFSMTYFEWRLFEWWWWCFLWWCLWCGWCFSSSFPSPSSPAFNLSAKLWSFSPSRSSPSTLAGLSASTDGLFPWLLPPLVASFVRRSNTVMPSNEAGKDCGWLAEKTCPLLVGVFCLLDESVTDDDNGDGLVTRSWAFLVLARTLL